MNKCLFPFLFVICLFVQICRDDEQSLILSEDYLKAATRNATIDAKSKNGSMYSSMYSGYFIMKFHSKDQIPLKIRQ